MIEYTNSQIADLINEYIHSARDRDLMKDRLIDGLTYERLAERYDISVAQVKRIVYKTQMNLFRHLQF